MALAPGTRLGPHEITSQIGAGGMGEVYQATDTRLGRSVAITRLTQRADRFEQETRAIAALNHPNICEVHDVGPDHLVMEYVEGTSPRGPMPVEEALRLGVQIAEALEEAHGKRILHAGGVGRGAGTRTSLLRLPFAASLRPYWPRLAKRMNMPE